MLHNLEDCYLIAKSTGRLDHLIKTIRKAKSIEDIAKIPGIEDITPYQSLEQIKLELEQIHIDHTSNPDIITSIIKQ